MCTLFRNSLWHTQYNICRSHPIFTHARSARSEVVQLLVDIHIFSSVCNHLPHFPELDETTVPQGVFSWFVPEIQYTRSAMIGMTRMLSMLWGFMLGWSNMFFNIPKIFRSNFGNATASSVPRFPTSLQPSLPSSRHGTPCHWSCWAPGRKDWN